MAFETSMDLEDQVEAFTYDYDEKSDECLESEDLSNEDEETLSQSENSVNSFLTGVGDFIGNNYSLLFFFLLLVIIFNSTGTFSESNESLLFFFLILVIIFNQFY